MKIKDSKWALLSVIRFILALIVMVSQSHITTVVKLSKTPDFFKILYACSGRAAVIGFLVISGYSVSYSYKSNIEGFMKRRLLRIYPLYFVAVLFTVFLQYYLGSSYKIEETGSVMVSAGVLTSLANFMFLQNIITIPITYNTPLWSLSVEMFMYLLIPLIFKLRSSYIYFLFGVSLLFFTYTDFIFKQKPFYMYSMLIYAWPFLLGCLLAIKQKLIYTIPLFILAGFSIYYEFNLNKEKFAVISFLLTSGMVLFSILVKVSLPLVVDKIFNFLGTISYPMYLFHFPLYLLLYDFGIRDANLFVCLVILIVIPVNYIFDDWLKKIFWKPLIEFLEVQLLRLNSKKSKTIVNA
jgi:peptidoglycan/LPS O-acetylase OafA/YrhL